MGSVVKCSGNTELNKVIHVALWHNFSEPLANLPEGDMEYYIFKMFLAMKLFVSDHLSTSVQLTRKCYSRAMKAAVFKVLTLQKMQLT